MIYNLTKYQQFHAFLRYRKQISWELALRDKSKIEGAYLLLKRFKNRLKNYDNALQKFDQKKCDKSELYEL